MKNTNKAFYLLLFVLALAVNFSGIKSDFFTDDPGLYAAIAKNLVYRKGFLELFTYNTDWLDKPHFPFWLVLASFKVFGMSTWAYRLPALLLFCISLVYTWLFARKYYGKDVAAAAVLILMTALHVQLSNTDTRAEPYLMALIIGAIYHIAKLNERYTFKHFVMAALLTACAVMTKGSFVLIAIYGALLGQIIFQRKLKDLLKLKWLALGLLTLIFTLPELYALYTQFDLHPEKTVFGRQGVSGLKWFLWDSQFGRFINKGPISRQAAGSKLFYVHTLLWAFAPWCLLFFYALYKNITSLFRRIVLPEYYTLTGGLLLLLLFSFSGFQLPFYTNAVFPLFAVLTAPLFTMPLKRYEVKFRFISQALFITLFPAVVLLLNYLLKPASSLLLVIAFTLFALMVCLIMIKVKGADSKILLISCAASLLAGFYMNTVVYPEITPYRGQIAAARYINQSPLSGFPVYSVKFENNIFQFYCKRPVNFIPIDDFTAFKPAKPAMFFLNQRSMDSLVHKHAAFTIIKSFLDFPQENILPAFLNKTTRHSVLKHVYLVTKPY